SFPLLCDEQPEARAIAQNKVRSRTGVGRMGVVSGGGDDHDVTRRSKEIEGVLSFLECGDASPLCLVMLCRGAGWAAPTARKDRTLRPHRRTRARAMVSSRPSTLTFFVVAPSGGDETQVVASVSPAT